MTCMGNTSALLDFGFDFGGCRRKDIKMAIIYLTFTKTAETIKYQALPIIKRPKCN